MSHLMTTFERRQTILRLLQHQTSVHVTELARMLDVSEGTIRNDLTALEESRLLVRVRGGAVLRNDQPVLTALTTRTGTNYEAKRRIARWAADMVEDGDAIALDASTTVLNIAPFLRDRRRLTIVTNGLEVARALAQNPSHTVILLGGVLHPEGDAVTGLLGEAMLKELYIKTAFVSCFGFSLENGLTESDLSQAKTKAMLVRAAARVVALVDSSKFDKRGLTPFASITQLAHIVTDDAVPPAVVEQLRRLNIGLTLCGEDAVDSYTPRDTSQRHYRIGFANLSEDIPFAVDVRRGLERAAQEAGNIDLVLADNQLRGETALNVAESLIARGVELVIEYQIDEKIGSQIMNKFQKAGIPVIAVDIPMVGATYFGVDNYRAGHMAGVALGQWIQDNWQGKIDQLIVLEEPRSGMLTASRIQGQVDGLREILSDSVTDQVIYLDSGNTSHVSEMQMLATLEKLPNLHRIAVVCFNDDAAIGALAAARRTNRLNDIVIVGQGADRRVREELRKPGSRIIGSTAFNPDRYGQSLIALALKILCGEPVPPAVYVDHAFVNPNNIHLYYPEA